VQSPAFNSALAIFRVSGEAWKTSTGRRWSAPKTSRPMCSTACVAPAGTMPNASRPVRSNRRR